MITMTTPLQMHRPIRLLLVDVHAISRQSSRMLLDTISDFEVVGETSEHDEAMRLLTELAPDVAIVSMRVQGSTGPDTAREILKLRPATRVVFWTLFDDPEYVRAALAAGAHAYVLKQDPAEEVEKAIAQVLGGAIYLSPSLKHIDKAGY
jgi:DNA-binding NarL/FixJ family response regulator